MCSKKTFIRIYLIKLLHHVKNYLPTFVKFIRVRSTCQCVGKLDGKFLLFFKIYHKNYMTCYIFISRRENKIPILPYYNGFRY